MMKLSNMARLLGPIGLCLCVAACTDSSSGRGQIECKDGSSASCPAGFLCTNKVCTESLSCDVRTKGAPNPTRSSSPKAKGDDCKNTSECAAGHYCDPFTKTCLVSAASGGACNASAACAAGEYCKEGKCTKAGCGADQICEETAGSAECASTGCQASAECGNLKCIESVCKAAPTDTPDDCVITNQARTFAEGAKIDIGAVALKAGEVIPFADYTVTTSDPAVFAVDGKTITANGKKFGSAEITVSFGGSQCTTTAQFFHTGERPVSQQPGIEYSRVVLYELGEDGQFAPVNHFKAGNFTFADRTGWSSPAELDNNNITGGLYYLKPQFVGNYKSLNIVADNYNPTTVVFEPSGYADISLPIERTDSVAGFGGEPSFDAFNSKFPSLASAGIAIAYGGGSLPLSSLLNFNLSIFVGDTAPVATAGLAAAFTGGGSSAGDCPVPLPTKAKGTGEIPLPRALYAQVGSSKLGVNGCGIAVRAIPGRRKPWSVGAKLNTTDVTKLIPVFTGTGGVNIGTLIDAVFPFFDNFAIGNETLGSNAVLPRSSNAAWNAYSVKSPNNMQSDASFPFVTASPSRRLKFITNFDNPGVVQDTFPGATDSDKMTGMVAIVASMSKPYGIVPLGFGAGLDQNGDGTLETLSAADAVRFPANKVHVRHAAPSADLSEADVAAITVTANLKDIVADMPKNPGVRLKGIVARDTATGLGWSKSAPVLGDFTTAVKTVNFEPTAQYAIGRVNKNTLTLPALGTTSTGADPKIVIMRISRDEASRYWNIIVNPGRIATATEKPITLVPDGFDSKSTDPVCAGPTCPKTTTISVSITTLDIKNAGDDFNANFGPSAGKDFDVLAGSTKSFSVYQQKITN